MESLESGTPAQLSQLPPDDDDIFASGDEEEGTSGIEPPIEYNPIPSKRNPVFRPCTDIDNAERLMYYHGPDLRYCYQAKGWFHWDGRRWIPDRRGFVDRCAEDVTRQIMNEASKEPSQGEVEKKAKWGLQSMSNRGIKNMIERAQSKCPITYEDFDTEPMLFNCANGVIDLTTGELIPPNRSLYMTKCSPVRYDPKATCPGWNDYLFRTMGNNLERVSFLQRAVGYSLTGDVREQVFFILFGSGSNGKSIFLSTLSEILADYAQQTPTETLMSKRNSGIPNDVARLRGARFVAAVETKEGRKLDEQLIKQLTGGDTISARFLNQEFFEFQPQMKIFLATNHKPEIVGTDNGIWRRPAMIPFEMKFWDADKGETGPDELKANKTLPQELKAEMPGILAWAVAGCLAWQKEGLNFPEDIRAATNQYRLDMDTLQDFINDKCVEKSNASCRNPELYKAYVEWAEESGEAKISQKSLTGKLKERGFTQKREGSARFWYGLGLVGDQQELPE